MKLQNKRTGEIIEIKLIQTNCDYLPEHEVETVYGEKISLATINRYYEDYNPTEPLIKDEKIRKAVRAWWETIPDTIGDKRIIYKNNDDFAVGVYTLYCGTIYPETLERNKMYTITELCGKDENS